MLTPLLAITLLLAPIQDAADETADNVREYLNEIESNLYEPQDHGLETLEFDLPFNDPMAGGSIGMAHVSWVKGSEPTIEVSVTADDLPPHLQAMKAMLPAQLRAQTEEMVKQLTGNLLSDLLEDNVGSLAGTEEDYVVVALTPKSDDGSGMNIKKLLVDGDALVARAVASMPNPMNAGAGELPVNIDFAWKDLGDAGYVLDRQTVAIKINMPPMGEIEQKTTISFSYAVVDDMHLLTRINTEMTTPMGPQSMEQVIENLVVNGRPVGGDAAATDEGEGEG
jgi:hypothetical protein